MGGAGLLSLANGTRILLTGDSADLPEHDRDGLRLVLMPQAKSSCECFSTFEVRIANRIQAGNGSASPQVSRFLVTRRFLESTPQADAGTTAVLCPSQLVSTFTEFRSREARIPTVASPSTLQGSDSVFAHNAKCLGGSRVISTGTRTYQVGRHRRDQDRG